MAYFNHAFNKVFLGTTGYQGVAVAPSAMALGTFAFTLANKPVGTATEVTLTAGSLNTTTQPVVLVSTSPYSRDKIGKFHGGYKETNRSKIINPKYVTDVIYVPPVTAQQANIAIGVTPFTNQGAAPDAGCQKNFECGNNYYLRLDIKGAPELRFLTRNAYYTAMAYTGCCPATGSQFVDPTTVYIQWAKALMESPLVSPFIAISIYNTTNTLVGVAYTKTGYDAAVAAGTLAWDAYTPVANASGLEAGMYIQGAYIDTQFGDCTFYPTDALQADLEPVKLYASEVDYNGDPCAFASLCVKNSCPPLQAVGTGEVILRELILSEGYNQSPFYTGRDLRIREITQGDQLANIINRNTLYHRYYIKHSVPRFNNPTGTFDNDQYLLEIITTTTQAAIFTNFIAYLTANGNPLAMTTVTAPSACTGAAVPPVPPVPNPTI